MCVVQPGTRNRGETLFAGGGIQKCHPYRAPLAFQRCRDYRHSITPQMSFSVYMCVCVFVCFHELVCVNSMRDSICVKSRRPRERSPRGKSLSNCPPSVFSPCPGDLGPARPRRRDLPDPEGPRQGGRRCKPPVAQTPVTSSRTVCG